MSKKEELAKEYRLKAVLNTERYLEGGSNIEKAYIAGWDAACSYNCRKILNLRRKAYAKGKEDFLDKACEWLKENSGYYVEHWGGDTWINSKLYEDFRKAMMEE